MDKNRDERRIISQQSGPKNNNKPHLLISGNVEEQKSVKRLSFLGTQMGGGYNDQHNQLYSTATLTSLKFKLPRKIFGDSNTSVPKKLRSAIRKRSCESGSVPLSDAKRLNNRVNGVELLGRDSFRCLKQNGWSDHSPKQTASLAISKDEEEVAETLFALAGMIPLDAIHENKKTNNESFEEKSADFARKDSSDSKPSFEDTMILKEEPEATSFSPNRLSERRQPNLNLKVSVPPATFQIPPLLRACDSTAQNQESMLNERKPEIYEFHNRDLHINIGVPGDLSAASEDKNNALPSKLLPVTGVDEFSARPSDVNFPSWLHNTSSTISCSFNDALSASKASCSKTGGRRSWKRCIAHVCISHLIRSLQTPGGKELRSLGTNQIRPLHCPASENNNNPATTLAAGHLFGSGAHKNEKCQATEVGSSFSGCNDLNKQSYNFLSLSTGVGAEASNGVNIMGMTLEGKGNALQLHSIGQHNTYVTCSLPQNPFPSIAYRDQAAVISGVPPSMPSQVNLQLPPYYGNSCGGPAHLGTTTRFTQHPPSKQQQIWTAQLAAQFRPGPFLSSHIAKWKNGTRDAHSVNHIQVPRPSQETMGANFIQISQQPQQQLFGLCQSLPCVSDAKLQHVQPPSACEDKGGRFHQDGVLPLQLLCNERLLS